MPRETDRWPDIVEDAVSSMVASTHRPAEKEEHLAGILVDLRRRGEQTLGTEDPILRAYESALALRLYAHQAALEGHEIGDLEWVLDEILLRYRKLVGDRG